jgi:hypothetical protein
MSELRQNASFATTHWSLVLAAGQRAAPESERALAALCQAYWSGKGGCADITSDVSACGVRVGKGW